MTLIIIDLNQVMISNIMIQLGNHTNAKLEESMIRHMVMNSILSYKKKFSDEYGSIVIACDAGNLWRKTIFPYYKANRKANNDKSELDWKGIYECLAKIREELLEYSPYKIIHVDTAEADDVIGTLVFSFPNEKILILSGDKDFIQLHNNPNVKQYDSVRNRWITHDDPVHFLREHIFKGDAIDGIPNILSEDNCLVVGTRQFSMTKGRLDYFHNTAPKDYKPGEQRNYDRNKQLIDLTSIPDKIKKEVIQQYNDQTHRNKNKLYDYFVKYRMKNMLDNLSEF